MDTKSLETEHRYGMVWFLNTFLEDLQSITSSSGHPSDHHGVNLQATGRVLGSMENLWNGGQFPHFKVRKASAGLEFKNGKST